MVGRGGTVVMVAVMEITRVVALTMLSRILIKLHQIYLLIIVVVLLLLMPLLILSLFPLVVLTCTPLQVVCQLCFQPSRTAAFCHCYFPALASFASSSSAPNVLAPIQSGYANDIS